MYLDNDYIKTNEQIWGVKGNWDKACSKILAKLVYEKNSSGTYIKMVDVPGAKGEAFHWIEPKSGIHIQSRFKFEPKMLEPNNRWALMWKALVSIGLDPTEIGYFGSKRLNFSNYKDVDFIIYGRKNLSLIKENIQYIKKQCKAYNITNEHIAYQIAKHAELYDVSVNSFESVLKNKWSSCMFGHMLCSTIRFVDSERDTGKLLEKIFNITGTSIKIKGIALGTDNTAFFPRQFTLRTENNEFDVVIPLWIFHQCVKENDFIEVTGIINENIIIVRDYNHGIKVL